MRHVGHVQRASAQANEESEGDGCQLVLTDAEESDDADAALVAPGKEPDIAALGTGEAESLCPRLPRTPISSQRRRKTQIVYATCSW